MSAKLKIEAVICDARKVQEETLSSYEKVELECVLLITNERARALFAKYPVHIECLSSIDCEDDISLQTFNGTATISAANAEGGRQNLVVNGKLTILPDAGEALKRYVGITVNGKVYCPDNLVSLLSGIVTVNGKLSVYPAEAIVLKDNFTLDKTFVLRAQPRLYWAARQIVALDEALDCGKLAAKGVRFAAGKALISEAIAEQLVPLFTEETQIEILPAATKIIPDDFELTPAALRRYGSRLYVDGDITIAHECAGLLGKLEMLTVKGDVMLPDTLEEEFYSIPTLEYETLRLYRDGLLLLSDEVNVHIDSGTLAQNAAGVNCINCATVTIAPEVSPAEITSWLTIESCAMVECSRAQYNAIASVCHDVAHIEVSDEKDKSRGEKEDEQTHVIEATQYTL